MLQNANQVQMIVDGQKMRSARARRALTQEGLANQARVNVRTIQRAESGMPIRHETLADIAAVLGMPPSGLLRPGPVKEIEVQAAEAEEHWGQVLKRADRAEPVIASLERSVMSALTCGAEPTPELMPALTATIKHLESLMRDPWDAFERAPLRFSSVLARLTAVAELNGNLAELERHGLALYVGSTSEYVLVPNYTDEGMVVYRTQNPQYAMATRLHIAEYSAERVRVPTDIVWPLEIQPEEEIPF